jgi:biopolymer transport protein ExbB
MLELFDRGGTMMYPLLLSSLLALTIIVERLITLRRKKIIIPEIIHIVEQFNSVEDIQLAKNMCLRYKGPLPRIISLGLENSDVDKSGMKELIEDQGRQEIRELLGLTGTVLGMIKVFGVIKAQGVGQAAALSGGISEALLTTVVGLFIGIPSLIFYNYFSRKAENFVLDIEKYSGALIGKLHNIKSEDQNGNRTFESISTDRQSPSTR